jgi:hypothetical protein
VDDKTRIATLERALRWAVQQCEWHNDDYHHRSSREHLDRCKDILAAGTKPDAPHLADGAPGGPPLAGQNSATSE